MSEYEPMPGDRVRCTAADEGPEGRGLEIDEVGRVLLVMREPCMVLLGDNGKTYVVALAAANLERLG